jgi:predicted acyltransferase
MANVSESADNHTSLNKFEPNQRRRRFRVLPSRADADGAEAQPQGRSLRPASVTATDRIASVDALRGFNIFWLLGADAMAWAFSEMTYGQGPVLQGIGDFLGRQLAHVYWEGMSFYDLIFPLLIFVTGLSIVLSLPRLVERDGRLAAHRRVLRRSLVLFALGLIYYGGVSHEWPEIRLLGVLQRIAICYLVTSVLFLNLSVRGLIVAFVAILVGYWALMTFVPVPGVGAGSYAPGENLANWIDFQFLPGQKWMDSWDPEGLLSTIPAIGSCLLGVFAGLLLQEWRATPAKASAWLIGGGIAMVGAGLLWGLQFPIIKNLWTSSYVLVAGGLSAILLGVFHHAIEVRSWRRWSSVFLSIGANALTLYFLAGVVNFQQLALRLVGGDVGNFFEQHVARGSARFLAAATGLALGILLARTLYRRKIFLRV